MGKEARERKERRNRTLTALAQENPNLFEQKWNERLNSWASEIWRAQKEQAHFTHREYDAFINRYPKAESLLADVLEFAKYGYCIYIEQLTEYQKTELGEEAVTELLSRVAQGGLRGEKVYAIADHAKQVLASCGQKAVALQQNETDEVLKHECHQAVNSNISDDLVHRNRAA